MAYAAVISLKQTINGLLNSSLVSSTREILEFAYDQTTSLQKVVEKFDDSSRRCSERLKGLEGQINQVEDALEFHELNESYSWEEVRQEISSFAEAVKKMEGEYIEELSKPVVAATPVSSHIDFGVEMVGRSAELKSIRDDLLGQMRPDGMWYFSILGDVGSDRTVVAKAYFEDRRQDEEQYFECGAWVTVGSNYEIEDVLIRILAYLDLQGHYEMLDREDKIICCYLNKILKSRRCLIVLDDVCDVELIHYLRIWLPDQSNGSLVMFTTSSKEVYQVADATYQYSNPKIFFEEIMSFILREVIFLW